MQFKSKRLIFLYETCVKIIAISYEGWNFNSGNYLFTTDTK